MHAYHRRMLAFDYWANTVSLEAVTPAAALLPKSVAWLSHIAAASQVWLARVAGGPMPYSVNPLFEMAELRAQLDTAHEGWQRFLDTQTDADITRIIHYTNLKGAPFSSPLGDILAHLPVHGQHHRGQINADLRAAGITPPVIDYIHAARAGAI